ncbi:MAG: glycerophosphodiester phosphodiesterase [Deltaproteobacteria bacterium]|nr:glycerophosphodiester phosphodiesterase [Deltaproteobacteria bacterium]MBW2551792.1 glycerophosphodiester phosphodiesterase [Deltaproteobacteria bacterium]
MNRLFLVLTIVSIAVVGCSSTGGQAGMGGEGGTGGTEPKCKTPQEMLRCDKVLNIAHGGGLLIRPAHTILAYDQALEDGADMLELDVHETIDHVIVVMHDAKVDRTTSCTGYIKEMTFAELGECDAGYNFTEDGGETYPYRDMGLVVPSLEEVLDRYPDTAVNIEIKQKEPSIVDNLVDLVREYEFEDKMVGASFSDEVVAELRDAAPEIATSLGEGETFVFWGNSFNDLDPEYEPPAEFLQVPIQFDGIDVLHPGFVPRAHELDMFVHVWTVNDEDEMRWLIEVQGVDGIMTDDPPLLTKVINELGVGD